MKNFSVCNCLFKKIGQKIVLRVIRFIWSSNSTLVFLVAHAKNIISEINNEAAVRCPTALTYNQKQISRKPNPYYIIIVFLD